MKKFLKTVLIVGGTALAASFGLKAYKKISGVFKLSKSLPEFLNNVYGEKPKIEIARTLSTVSIKVGFTQAILDKHTDIDTTVREYIDDFYPELAKSAVDINVYVRSEDEEPTTNVEDSTEEA